MTDIPERIYLGRGKDESGESHIRFGWWYHRQGDSDIEYIRAQGWISVEDRLPEIIHTGYSEDVWVYYLGYQGTGKFFKQDGQHWWDLKGILVNNVSHWRKKPPPPASLEA